MRLNRTAPLTFEVGDRAYCPYYGKEGFIINIHIDQNATSLEMILQDIITIQYGDNPEDCIYTKLIHRSANLPVPTYLQMVCKKDDINWNFISQRRK